MQIQITNQLLLFGIMPHEYTVLTQPWGETTIGVAGHTVAVIPATGRKSIVLDRQWTLDRIHSDSLVLAVSAVIAALLRCRRPVADTLPPLTIPTLPAPHKPQHGAAGTPWKRLGGITPLPTSQIPSQNNTETMVDKTPSPCGGEAATTHDYEDITTQETATWGEAEFKCRKCGHEKRENLPHLSIYPTDNHSPEMYE